MTGIYDESSTNAGVPRASWAAAQRALGSIDVPTLLARQHQADRLLDAEGAGHLVHELALDRNPLRGGASTTHSRPWRLDPLPFVIDAAEFAFLAKAAAQRMRLLSALIDDCHGAQRVVREGCIPGQVLFGLPSFRPSSATASRNGPALVHYALDIVRDSAGVWRIVQDLTDAPSGLGYALLNRSVLSRLIPEALRSVRASAIHDHADALRQALTLSAPPGRPSPRIVVLSSGPTHPTYVEHSYLATRLGFHLVEGADMVMREGRLWLRALDGLEPIDVVYRRIEDALLDPLEAGHRGAGTGIAGIVWGASGAGLTLANSFGSALGEASQLWPYLSAASELLIGERPLLDTLDESAGFADLATAPVFCASGEPRLGNSPVVVRLQVVMGPDGPTVMNGGTGRVLAAGDDPKTPTALRSKDVWVIGAVGASRSYVVTAAPQVDFGTSVPTRAAAALYWMGRAAERAEVAARCTRVVGAQLDQDPTLMAAADGAWTAGVIALLAAAQATGTDPPWALSTEQRIDDALRAAASTAAVQIATLVQEASTVREYLSTATGRILGRLAQAHGDLIDQQRSSDRLDSLLVDLAALSGQLMESTFRGPAWRFLDLGRRLERSLAVLGAVEAGLGMAVAPMAFQPLAEVVLASHESLVAYRRIYRSDVDRSAVLDLLTRNDSNPRSITFQLDRIREHVAGLAWSDGAAFEDRASIAALAPFEPTQVVAPGGRNAIDQWVHDVRTPLLQLSDAIVQRWFADPVRPTIVRSGS